MDIAIVTGVLGGIGRASAEELIKAGYHVVGMDVTDADGTGDMTYAKSLSVRRSGSENSKPS